MAKLQIVKFAGVVDRLPDGPPVASKVIEAGETGTVFGADMSPAICELTPLDGDVTITWPGGVPEILLSTTARALRGESVSVSDRFEMPLGPLWSISGPTSIAEGNGGTTNVTFVVSLVNHPGSGTLTINVASSGTGANPVNASDVVGGAFPATTLSFTASGSQNFVVPIAGDTTVEPNEGLRATISSPSAGTITTATSDATITNDDEASTIVAYAPIAEQQAYEDRLSAAGITAPNEARRRAMNRLQQRFKSGALAAERSKIKALNVIGAAEGHWLTNLITPGINDLVKVGTPTFSTNLAVSSASASNYYEWPGITLGSIPQDDFSFGVLMQNFAASTIPIAGARDTGSGIDINPLNASGFSEFRAMCAANTAAIGNNDYWNGLGWHTVHRRGSSGYQGCHHGYGIGDVATASVAPTNPTRALRLLVANGVTTAPNTSNRLQAAFVAYPALSEQAYAELAAAVRDYVDTIMYGNPYIEPAGMGDAVVTVDHLVYGFSMAGMVSAYHAARSGLSVAIVGGELDETQGQLGGMPGAGGLSSIDASDGARVSGLFREIISWCNLAYYGDVDGSTDAKLSPQARAFNMACRRMFDPNKTTGAGNLPGQNVKIYISGGASAVQVDGSGFVTGITTVDGRQFNANWKVVDASYDCELIPLMPGFVEGVDYTRGVEAAGTGLEAANGYKPNTAELIRYRNIGEATETPFFVNPYVTEGVSSSGLLPDIRVHPEPGLTANGADPTGLQSMNYRVPVLYADGSSPSWRSEFAPLTKAGSPPRGYNPARVEFWARLMKSATDQGVTMGEGAWGRNGQSSNRTWRRDLNYFDRPNSGVDWANATTRAQRIAVMQDVEDYIRGTIYFLRHGTDPRIQATSTTFWNKFSLNALEMLDPPSWGSLHWPTMPYRRTPRYRLINPAFILTANDTGASSGTASRSPRVISCTSYPDDLHEARRVAAADPDNGGIMICWKQGAVSYGSGGVKRAPVPADVLYNAKAKNMAFLCGGSWTNLAHATVRMEFTLCLLGEGDATYSVVAKRDGVKDTLANVYSNGTDGVKELMTTGSLYTTPAYLPASA